ncbi:MAG: Isoprenyl transferase [Candidatus Woesebacteria bacterium GW2011_GWB1_43_14]|uniref:Isoprenyl transferase n=1 Tax=Candidatus Woesebacteria bacterium GW2011_GWB1_43_14 TaxID=1618578 RepID=A0A0G1DG76_9BACT|nr:MAG: Isoprenyl transferase [Candidatus Woesebacteria bacterium GW2011_GWC1_42_9]KKS96905.1 MAG: Isoprenyl transferase [Candidatus Woesebacteria bacterium GW2011_GWB1_43_14]
MRDIEIKLPKGTKIPNHVAIIPDGNRRWARARGLHTLKGHKAGFERAVELARAARRMGVHTVTLWGFSTENWDRTEEEVGYLMRLYVKLINDYLKEADQEKVRLVHLGRKDRLPEFLVKKIVEAEKSTFNNHKYVVNLAIDYGGHDEIIRAVKGMIKDDIPENKINKKLFEKYLDTWDQLYPYVDLLIRTSGEQRTSGLLLWQMEYAEMYWEDDHFPDFTPEKLRNAILDYSCRRRRFGGNDNEGHFKFKPEVTAKLELDWWRLGNIPEGTKFREYAAAHIREQWGVSKSLAKEAGGHLVLATLAGEKKHWKEAAVSLKRFYRLIRDEVKLAFEPSLAASLGVKLWQKPDEDTQRKFIAEVYRISDFQAAKAAHLRSLASKERVLAEAGEGDEHWQLAKEYLLEYYKALKDRVA